MSSQFIRKCSLIVYGANQYGGAGPSSGATATPGATQLSVGAATTTPLPAQDGLDLSAFRIQFSVTAMDADAPPTALIRVMNLADSTVQKIQNEFQNVTLQAGYEGGNFGVIFQGSIVRIRKGRLSNIDTFVDIMAANFDAIYNFGVVSKTLKAGATYQDRATAIQQGVADSPAAQGTPSALAGGMQYGNIPSSFNTGGTLPRGKVLFGMARDHLQDLADTAGCSWSVGPDGKVSFLELTQSGYPGQAVVITAQTGMVGIPEATQQGIEVKCLLNPLIRIGTQVQLDNASINTTQNLQATGFPAYGDFAFFANTSDDGFYRALVVEHEGDTRGHGGDWLTKITALSLDSSGAGGAGSVQSYGWQGS